MKPFIEDRNGNKYEFDTLTRRQKLKLANSIKKIDKENFEEIEDVFYDLLTLYYPSVNAELYEDILDFNEEKYGFNALYELIGTILGDVFTTASGVVEIHPYLQEKMKAEPQVEVEEKPQEEETNNYQTPVNSIYY